MGALAATGIDDSQDRAGSSAGSASDIRVGVDIDNSDICRLQTIQIRSPALGRQRL